MIQRLRDRFNVISRYSGWYTAKVLLPFVTAFVVGCLSIRQAYMTRGYFAVGGEYILILFTAYVSYKAVHIIFCLWRSRKARRRLNGGSKKRRGAGASWLRHLG